jgi:hypothetical protein
MKKFQKRRFLDFVFKIFFKTPHPNPLLSKRGEGIGGSFSFASRKNL